MIQDTSLEAFYSILDELGSRQKQVYATIKKNKGMSNLDISRYLNLPINSVTPRVKELRDLKIVKQYGDKVDRVTKRRMKTWMVVE